MGTTQITREELTQKVLAAVRQQPGCDGVKEVSVTPVNILDQGQTWDVSVIDKGDAKIQVVHSALRQVHDQLAARYQLA